VRDWSEDDLRTFTSLLHRFVDDTRVHLHRRDTSPAPGNRRMSTATASSRNAPDASGTFSHRQILTILSGLMMGMFLAALDQTVVSTAIRTIADDLQGFELQAWATTAFLITSTITTPLYGKLSDIYGRRPFYLAAITIFVAGSMLCGLAESMYQLAASVRCRASAQAA
jgi:Na+/melibiose symporter-like transporter